jgi:hypothetical protein
MGIRVTIDGNITELQGTIQRLPATLERTVIERMSQIAYDRAQDGAGRHVVTGALLQSLYNRAIPGGREVGHDPARAPHAIFVHFGTKPHEIRPRNKKALRWASGNGFVFAKVVKHPGYRGDPYLFNAADEAVRSFRSIVDELFPEAFR